MPIPIQPHDLVTLMVSDIPHAVVDIRPREDFVSAQIFTSTTLPIAELDHRLRLLVPAPVLPMVLVGATEADSRAAAGRAEALGFGDARWLADGFEGWRRAGLPTIDGWSVPGKDFGERLLVQEPVPEIDANELAQLQSSGKPVIVLDSRTPAEFERSCIPDGENVPGGQLPLEITDILARPENADATVVVNCAGRTRSILGAFQLQRMGIPRVRALRNGTMGWLLAGQTLDEGRAGWTPHRTSPQSLAAAETAADAFAAQDGVHLIAPQDLQLLQGSADPVYVVDARMPHEYLAGHIAGALTVPGGQLPFSDDQIAVCAAQIVTVCDGRARGIFAASLWQLMGFPHVRVLDGGIPAWTAAGLELERGGEERPFVGGGVRTREGMRAYLEWEEALGAKYAAR